MSESLNAVILGAEKAEKKGDLARAASLVVEYLKTHKNETHSYPFYGAGYYFHGIADYTESKNYLKKAVQLNPCFKEAWRLLASSYQETGEDRAAAGALEKCAGIDDEAHLWYQTAVLWLKAGDPKKALKIFERLKARGPMKPQWLAALSIAQKALKKKEAAAESMERAAHLSRDPSLIFQAAFLWLDADHPEKALPLLKKLANRRHPKNEWLLTLVDVCLMLNRTLLAAETMERVVKRDPDPSHLYRAGVLWLYAKRPEKALEHLLPLCRKTPAEAEWFVALAHVRLQQKKVGQAAESMERAAHLSGKPEHAYQAGVMWLEAEDADGALRLLVPLNGRVQPKALWLVALSNAWVLKEVFGKAAESMEQAARISGESMHLFQAARLWLAAEQPTRALPLLEDLISLPSPRGEWYIALANCCLMLDQPKKAASEMEKGALITQQGNDYYRAGMLWVQVGDIRHGLSLFQKSVTQKPVKQEWLVNLARVLVDSGRKQDALPVMERTALLRPKISSDIRYQGALLWLLLGRPEKALPVLESLCALHHPSLDWLVTLVKTHMDLKQVKPAEKNLNRLLGFYPENPDAWRLAVWVALQKSDYGEAAAAMAVAIRLVPPDSEQMKKMVDLYQLAGVPVKAAEVFQKTWPTPPQPHDWDRLANLYLGAHRYEMALAAAKSAVKAQESGDRWKTVGEIAFRMRRFKESHQAYLRSVCLKPDDPELRLKAGYAALKMEKLDEAEQLFKAVMGQTVKGGSIHEEALRHLTFIKEMKSFLSQNNPTL